MTRTASFYIDRALEAFNAGFVSKAGKQSALGDLNHAYDTIRRDFHSKLCADAPAFPESADTYPQERVDFFNAHDVPFDLHCVRPRHIAIFNSRDQDAAVTVSRLWELRIEIKGGEVNAPVRNAPSVYEVRAMKTIKEIMELRQTQYAQAINLAEVFGQMPVSATTHWCIADTGTRYLRTFWYLAGKMTPLNVLCCAAEELERRKEAVS